MRPVGLIDTGAIVALIDRDDRWHTACVEAFNQTRFPLLTTEAVLTEVFHLLGRNLRQTRPVWTLLQSGAIHMAAISNEGLAGVHDFIKDYADHDVDFADATLVFVAARESLSTILTVDFNDFETYRLPRGKKFSILPTRIPRSK